MLQLKNIVKTYVTGDLTQDALKGVSIAFRESEFVSILGQSGSGKTTMLNIIGGLDRYNSGDLLINGVSTKEYKDADWDYYRNNSIGFVFQSYNLIPHQSVLANVEMALTLAGVSKKERRQRAIDVLKKVGLGDHIYKKPNQMSGGQMQRVAIARALINNPDILLADEPTGALDSETSVQIMELLKEIAKDKQVVMVTHNPELAEKYSTRIVRLLDGQIVSDSNPYNKKEIPQKQAKRKKISMSFLTALSLSFNNLRTKKGRTLLTAFAGSIGIIGIALILALSTGMNVYIADVQKETMSSYPITISDETIDVSGIMGMRGEMISVARGEKPAETKERTDVYADYKELEASEMITSNVVENNLTDFKQYLDDPDSEIRQYLGENGIIYTYDVNFNVYSYDADGNFVDTDQEIGGTSSSVAGSSGQIGILNRINGSTVLGGGSSSGAENFSELMSGADGKTVSQVISDSYDILYGSWPEEYNEVVLVLNEEELLSNAVELKITGVIRPKEAAANASISTTVAYTSKLTDYVISHTDESAVIQAQEADREINVLTGMKFESQDDAAKVNDAKSYLSSLGVSEKASFYKLMMYYASSNTDENEAAAGQNSMVLGGMTMDEATMAAALDQWLAGNPNEEILLKIYEEYIAGSTYEENMKAFGKVSYDAPASISIYTDSFQNKDSIADCIERYNEAASEDAQIVYTDYVAMLTSSITTIIDSISYVLVAFVAISLVVSCIMIGIITHISVMERTKEIGILRALGASKRNISQVFNAETFIIGCCAGLLGIGVSLLALIPINSVIEKLTGIADLNAQLSLSSSVILIAISIVITMVGGLLPAKKAAKKDPVIALRTE